MAIYILNKFSTLNLFFVMQKYPKQQQTCKRLEKESEKKNRVEVKDEEKLWVGHTKCCFFADVI